MKIFFKSRFYEGEQNWVVIHFDKPLKDSDGRLIEGKVNLQVGRDNQIKGAFKLSIDETRALISALKGAVRFNDDQLVSLLNPPTDVEVYEKQEFSDQQPIEQSDFKLFEELDKVEKKVKEDKEESYKPEVYY